ncbi:MAG TPA: PEP-CTERM sorting domain-containing protein [Stellaceae bacterium]|nr:PEP-CTERM sorting domain-containing protein [Stellaceae bacterium]
MKANLVAGIIAATIAIGTVSVAEAAVIDLTFEGLQNLEPIDNFYNGGLGGNGSGPGPNFGIIFSANSLALIEDSAGGTGNIQGEPSPVTAAFFLSGGADTMDVPAGFTTGFSFFYSAINNPGVINVWSGLDGTGSLLATLALPVTPMGPYGTPPCTIGSPQIFCPFEPIGVSFSGTAESVDFGGTANQIAFDNITLGSSTPVGGVPEPASLTLLGVGLAGFGVLRHHRKSA